MKSIIYILSMLSIANCQAHQEKNLEKKTRFSRGLAGLGHGNLGYKAQATVIGQDYHTTITRHIGIPIPHPVAVPVERHIPIPIKVPIAVPVDRPYAVPVPKQFAVPVDRPYPVAVDRPFAVAVPQPVAVPIVRQVGIPIPQPFAVGVRTPVPIPQPFQFPLAQQTSAGIYSNLLKYGGNYGSYDYNHG